MGWVGEVEGKDGEGDVEDRGEEGTESSVSS